MAAMTTKDIRDIAAYWGSPCAFSYEPEFTEDIDTLYSETVNHHILGAIFRNPHRENKITDIKLQLRPISSLTDEEVRECAKLDAGGGFLWGDIYQIDRRHDCIVAYYGNGASVEVDYDCLISDECPSTAYPAIIAYLQSIHVYVPGTIDEKYVQLTT